MKFVFKSVLMLTAIAVCFTNCKKEETDVRDAAVGTYAGTQTYCAIMDGQLTPDEDIFGKPETVTNITVSKDNTNANAIQINLNGDILYGSKIAALQNGFSFDMEEQTMDGITATGYNAIEVGTAKYHGAFFSDTKKITFGIKASVNDLFKDDQDLLLALTLANVTDAVIIYDLNKR